MLNSNHGGGPLNPRPHVRPASPSSMRAFAYDWSNACSASMNTAVPPPFWTSAIACSASVVLPLDSGPKIWEETEGIEGLRIDGDDCGEEGNDLRCIARPKVCNCGAPRAAADLDDAPLGVAAAQRAVERQAARGRHGAAAQGARKGRRVVEVAVRGRGSSSWGPGPRVATRRGLLTKARGAAARPGCCSPPAPHSAFMQAAVEGPCPVAPAAAHYIHPSCCAVLKGAPRCIASSPQPSHTPLPPLTQPAACPPATSARRRRASC